ncbi:MAG TPA: hypothetical protein VKZ18_19175 [Polyangia bacterium]|nr:hypothetical protein [Polyangia bacterium]
MIELEPLRPVAPGDGAGQIDVVASVAGGADPLPVAGSRLAYEGLTPLTGYLVAEATRPWAERHRASRPGGWQLLVEITRSDAELRAARLTIEVDVRVTLRATVGQTDLAQTQGHCKVTDAFLGDGSPVVTACLERLSRDVAGWLQGRAP